MSFTPTPGSALNVPGTGYIGFVGTDSDGTFNRGRAFVPIMAATSHRDSFVFSTVTVGQFYITLGVDAFRVWRDGSYDTIEQHLRLSQRNDGLGTAQHPRLRSSQNASTSKQTSVAPRLGQNYL